MRSLEKDYDNISLKVYGFNAFDESNFVRFKNKEKNLIDEMLNEKLRGYKSSDEAAKSLLDNFYSDVTTVLKSKSTLDELISTWS